MTTGMLASVTGLDEALLVHEAGADIIDLKDPGSGALGALVLPEIREVVGALNGCTTISATIGDLPYHAGMIEDAVEKTAACGVDIVKVGIFGDVGDDKALAVLSAQARLGTRIVLVLFAEDFHYQLDYQRLAGAGISGVMLDTRDKESGSLRGKLADERLTGFVQQARAAGLMTGLAGSLQLDDIEPLLIFEPDYLGFRGALCRQQQRTGVLNGDAVCEVRSLIPKRLQELSGHAITYS